MELPERRRMILMPDGKYEPVDKSGMAYLLRGTTCEKMKLRMRESKTPSLDPERFSDVAALWTFYGSFKG